MTNMTRRNFLKSAGVMALAVAAAGVLSGCDSSKNPVMADVEVQYWYESLILGQKQVDDGSYTETVSVVKSGKVKKEQIEEILSLCEVKPTVLQTELHPYHQESELKAFLKENGIVPQAWYPLGHGDKALLQEPLFAQLGAKYGKSAPQIILRWHIQSGNIVIPGSKNPEHIKSNFDLFDFALTDDEMAQIAALNRNVRYYTSTPEMLKKYAEMVPPVDEQK